MSKYLCPYCECKDEIPDSQDQCPACQQQLPAPNVRAASNPKEIEALDKRLHGAEEEAGTRKALDTLNEFGEAVQTSSTACINVILGAAQRLLSNNQLYNSFYQQLDAKSRVPENNEYDKIRGIADELLFPNYKEHIIFAALSLNERGPSGYGPHTLALKEDMIAHRASIFETNSLNFCKIHGLGVTKPVPFGYRGTWNERGKLAKSKLHSYIDKNTISEDFANILLQNLHQGTDADEFIEIHIYNGFSRGAISKVVFGEVKAREDKLLIRSLQRKLTDYGIEYSIESQQAKAS